MKSLLPLIVAAPLLALAACNSQPSQPEVVDTNPDPMANILANRAPVELPPAIKSDKTFRCKDQSLAFVTFFQGDKQVNVRLKQGDTPVKLTAPAAGEPLTAEGGWKMTGDEKNITLTTPKKAAQTCHI
ncbi:putative lipoprotein [Sphingomonas sp. S17]|nr:MULTISPECIES: hypothetical protein [Sphingomonas]EGI54831.1 putative lipoprotein [Sphingomonas sp. S17]MBQ1479477.1 hypothetical protein [Sphingomonas sp.]MCM3678046.1 hypothetical protein [Sphingomonas paucimobilis]MDG5972678.1 hypothetical protein [Sphingomonas paucimobilis]NNG59214.1 hypothetical protein [Sphingomonas paucimobilis]